MWPSIFRPNQCFPGHSIITDVESLYEFKFFSKKFWRAARAREITSPRKTSIFFECCKKWPQQKTFFTEIWGMVIEKNLDWQNFCETLLATRIWYYVKKEGPRWCKHAKILQYFMLMLLYVHQSFFEIWRWLIYEKTSIFDGANDETKIKWFT